MNLTISDEHTDLIAALRQLLARPEALAARFREQPPTSAERRRLVDMLDEFGLTRLELASSPRDFLSAALIVEECGAAAAGVPAAPLALAHAAGQRGLLHPIGRKRELLLNHLDLELPSRAVDPDGRIYEIENVEPGPRPARPVVPFASRARAIPTDQQVDPWLWAAGVTLMAFGGLGAIDAALKLCVEHVTTRVQFGRPLAAFQSIRNRIADLVVARNGLRELCHYTLWRAHAKPSSATVDALLLRRQHTNAVREGLLSAHQMHGAIGFCYEYPLVGVMLSAELDRHVPFTEPECMHELVQRYTEIDMHYDEELPPIWNLVRTDRVTALEPAV